MMNNEFIQKNKTMIILQYATRCIDLISMVKLKNLSTAMDY